MLFLIVMPIDRDKILTLTLNLEQIAADHITMTKLPQIMDLSIGDHVIIQDRYVVVRIQ